MDSTVPRALLRVLVIPSVLCAGPDLLSQVPSTLEVDVLLTKPEAGGVVRVALCPDRDAYDHEVACSTLSIAATGPRITARFEDVTPGDCAIKVFHDINNDGRLNTNWIGWPQEPYGFSNDAPVNMGPPPFKLAMITVKEGVNSTRIALR